MGFQSLFRNFEINSENFGIRIECRKFWDGDRDSLTSDRDLNFADPWSDKLNRPALVSNRSVFVLVNLRTASESYKTPSTISEFKKQLMKFFKLVLIVSTQAVEIASRVGTCPTGWKFVQSPTYSRCVRFYHKSGNLGDKFRARTWSEAEKFCQDQAQDIQGKA